MKDIAGAMFVAVFGVVLGKALDHYEGTIYLPPEYRHPLKVDNLSSL